MFTEIPAPIIAMFRVTGIIMIALISQHPESIQNDEILEQKLIESQILTVCGAFKIHGEMLLCTWS
jgi:hypothetical protein